LPAVLRHGHGAAPAESREETSRPHARRHLSPRLYSWSSGRTTRPRKASAPGLARC